MAKSTINYTTINHEARCELGLTINEYCVFDLIHNLATNPKNDQLGWCYARKETLADYLDISRATVFRAIKKGLDEELLEKHQGQSSLLRATGKWYETVIIKVKSQNDTPSLKMKSIASQNETLVRIKKIHNKDIYKENDNNTVKPKGFDNINGKKGPSSIADVLKDHQILTSNNRIKHDWQVEALRLWQEIGLAGTPSRQFFRHIKYAFKKHQQGKLTTALSYVKDARNVDNPEKLFYWRFRNNPNL